MKRNGHLGMAMFMPVLRSKVLLRSSVCSLHLLLRRCLAGLFLLGFGNGLFMPFSLQFKVGMPMAWSQEWRIDVEVLGVNRRYAAGCSDTPLFDEWTPVYDIITNVGDGEVYAFGGRFGMVFAEYSTDVWLRFIVTWQGRQEPPRDTYLVLRYYDYARLRVTVPGTGGSATARFNGNLLSASVSLRGCNNPDETGVCHESVIDSREEIRPYHLSFIQDQETGLWKAKVIVPFQSGVGIRGSCPPPPLSYSQGDVDFTSSIAKTTSPFVWIAAGNEPSYHKGDDCIAVMNNTKGPLDERYGDTAVELCGVRYAISMGTGDPGTPFTDWYLGNRMAYTRMLHGNWCPGDCPLNEWWICGAYYKDNLFHEFTSVNAVIGGCPKTDCEDWFIGTEVGWNDEPSLTFWLREDVRRRVSKILNRLPFKYHVGLKVTDNYGNGPFSDSANYTMTIHAPLENYTPESSQYVYLPQQVGDARRPCPTCFIPSPSWGATLLAVLVNRTELVQEVEDTIMASDTYTLSTTISGECSAMVQRPLQINQQLANIQFTAKFGASKTVSTTTTYEVGRRITMRVPPHTRLMLYAQRAATIEKGKWDVYGWDGYLGVLITENMDRNSYFEFLWKSEPVD